MVKDSTQDGMHIIQPYVPKINCIYILDDRTCQCKDCYYFLGFCTDPDVCPFKVKEGEDPKKCIPMKRKKRIVDIDCSLPESTIIHGRFNKIGVIHHYEKQGRKLFITFGEGKKEYIYPESFQSRAIWVDDELYEILAKDISKAKVE